MKRSNNAAIKLVAALLLALGLYWFETRWMQGIASHVALPDSPPAAAAAPSLPSQQDVLERDWASSFNSKQCLAHRTEKPGTIAFATMGKGQRTKCFPASLSDTLEYKIEIEPSFDISLKYKTIYLPVMKAGTQMFQEVFRHRLRGQRILSQRALLDYVKRHGMRIEDFFIFSFVRNPFRMFVSSYEEVNKYVMNNRTRTRGFGSIALEQEPARAMECLENVRSGLFHGLVPAHMYPQLWKLQRCDIPVHFVGKLENVEEDWAYIEKKLGLPHKDLPVIHSASLPSSKKQLQQQAMVAKEMTSKEILGKFETNPGKFRALTQKVCDYYQADFDCFGYEDNACMS